MTLARVRVNAIGVTRVVQIDISRSSSEAVCMTSLYHALSAATAEVTTSTAATAGRH